MLNKFINYLETERAWSLTQDKLSRAMNHISYDTETVLDEILDAVVKFGPARVWESISPQKVVKIWRCVTSPEEQRLLQEAQPEGWLKKISYLRQVEIVERWLDAPTASSASLASMFDIPSNVVLEGLAKYKNNHGSIDIEHFVQPFVLKAILKTPNDTTAILIKENKAHSQQLLERWWHRFGRDILSPKRKIPLEHVLRFFEVSAISSLIIQSGGVVLDCNGKYVPDTYDAHSNVVDSLVDIYTLAKENSNYTFLRHVAAYKNIPTDQHSEENNIHYSMNITRLSSLEQMLFFVGAEQERSNIDISKMLEQCNEDVKIMVSLGTHTMLAASFGDPIKDTARFQELIDACTTILQRRTHDVSSDFEISNIF